MSKKRNPDWVVWGSTALAANWEDSISSISFLLRVPFTFLRGMGKGSGLVSGLVLAWGLERRREMSSVERGVNLERLTVSVTCMLAMETGCGPSLVMMRKMGRNPWSRELMEKILDFSGVS